MVYPKKRVLSGIQPSGQLTIGNYLGAIKNWKKIQASQDFECFFMIADLHSITVKQKPESIFENSLDMLAMLVACGIDPYQDPIFFQSHVPSHTELMWIFLCNSYVGELFRMTQFKDKSKKQENISTGLLNYPVLMAADILLYGTDFVPVGVDQRQHLELARSLAIRFNNFYGETFKIPEPLVLDGLGKIMNLQNPSQKMSKSSENENSYILLQDSKEKILKKIKKSVTDSDNKVMRGSNKQGIENLMNIYSGFCQKQLSEVEAEFENKGYGFFKESVALAIWSELELIQNKYKKIILEKDELKKIYKSSAKKVNEISKEKIKEVYKKIGFIN